MKLKVECSLCERNFYIGECNRQRRIGYEDGKAIYGSMCITCALFTWMFCKRSAYE